MKSTFRASALLLIVTAGGACAATQFGWAGNAGWIDFAPSAQTRVSSGPAFLQGHAHAPNFGWVDLGDGSPENGNNYSNTSDADFGVNHDGTGNLSGFAYGANIGWINFGWAGPADPARPRIDLVTGRASGFAYAANVGWIALDDVSMPGVTAHLTLAGGSSGSVEAGTSQDLLLNVFGSENLAFTWLRNGLVIAQPTDPALGFPSVQTFQAGSYAVQVRRADGSIFEVEPFELDVVTPAPSGARLVNLSTRARAMPGDNLLIPGFFVSGSGVKQLLLRVVGPTLASFGVSDVLADPRMTVQREIGGAFVFQASNDDWGTNGDLPALLARTAAVGAFDLEDGSADAVLDYVAEPGAFTVIADGAGSQEGTALVEIYDADEGEPTARLSNLSIRAVVGSGDDAVIPGFVISPEGPVTLLIRAIGPGLEAFGISGVLADPKLTVFSESDRLFENDNWQDLEGGVRTAEIGEQVGAFSLETDSADAAMVVTLAPGPYTVQLEGAQGGAGLALFELYEVR